MTELSYHDLHITTESMARTCITDLPFNVIVQCTRAKGWEVWYAHPHTGERLLIAGEYHSGGLILDAAGDPIVNSFGVNQQVADARQLAIMLFEGHFDRGGHPYIEHVARVAEACTTVESRAAAWLHDVVEDTGVSLDDLLDSGFSTVVVDAVDALTRRNREDYLAEYIPRLVQNPLACEVKIHDLRDNMNMARISTVTRADVDRWIKYDTALTHITRVACAVVKDSDTPA